VGSPSPVATTGSSGCGGSRSDDAFCEWRGRNGKNRELVAKFVKQKSKTKTLGFQGLA
jgi:hypothetical protein